MVLFCSLGFARTLDLFVRPAMATERGIMAVSVLGSDVASIALGWSRDENINNFVFFVRSGRSDSGRAIAKGDPQQVEKQNRKGEQELEMRVRLNCDRGALLCFRYRPCQW